MTRTLGLSLLSVLFVTFIAKTTAGQAEDSASSPATANEDVIVVQNYYYARAGKAEEVYRWRLHASEVRTRLGLASGRVLRREPGTGDEGTTDLPDVVWECEYPNARARTAEVERLSASREFDEVEVHMSSLLRHFRRATFSLASKR